LKGNFYLKDYYTEDEPKRPVSVAEWGLFAFILWALISAVAGTINGYGDIVWRGAPNRFEGFISYFCYVFAFFVIARFYKPNPRRQHLHLSILAVSVILLSLYGILQFVGIDLFDLFPHDRPDFASIGSLTVHFRTTLGNIGIVAAYCSFAVMLFAALFALSDFKYKWRQFLYIGASAASFALHLIANREASKVSILGTMILLIPYWISNRERLAKILIVLSSWCATFVFHHAYLSIFKWRLENNPDMDISIGNYGFLLGYNPINFGLFIGLTLFLLAAGLCLFILPKKLGKLENWNERIMKISGAALLVAALVGGILFVEIAGRQFSIDDGRGLRGVIFQAREIMHGRLEDDFGSARGWVWRRGVSVIPNNPILGTGPDTFEAALGDELRYESLARYGFRFDKAHNVFLQIAVCMGIPALIAYLVFLVSLFASAVKKAFERPFLLAFGAAAVSYMIQSFFFFLLPITTPLVWISFGMMASEIWMEKVEKVEQKDENKV
jgi:hypothetical protein